MTVRESLIKDMRARDLPAETIVRHLEHIDRFTEHFSSCGPLDRLGPRHIRAFQMQLLVEGEAPVSMLEEVVSALRFLYNVTLGKPWPVKPLAVQRIRLIEDMRMRNFSPHTIHNYVRRVALFAEHYQRSPERLGKKQVRDFLAHLASEARVSYCVLNQFVCALRFFYKVTLDRPRIVEDIPLAKKAHRLPAVLSREQVLQFLAAVPNVKHRAMLTTCYAAGLRVSEVTQLKVSDIDSARMVLHVRQGKGKKDRLIPLSEKLLEILREYWRLVRPRDWLFPSSTGPRPLSRRSVEQACRNARERVGLGKNIKVHTLRHYAGSRIMPGGIRRAA